MDNLILHGIANQDQDIADMMDCWNKTPLEAKSNFIDFLEIEDPKELQAIFNGLPVAWLVFIRNCTVIGLRQGIINERT